MISALARVEVPAALWRKTRTGELDDATASILVSTFESDFHGDHDSDPRFTIVAPTEPVLVAAAREAARHALRAYDAMQLASARSPRGRSSLRRLRMLRHRAATCCRPGRLHAGASGRLAATDSSTRRCGSSSIAVRLRLGASRTCAPVRWKPRAPHPAEAPRTRASRSMSAAARGELEPFDPSRSLRRAGPDVLLTPRKRSSLL